MRALLLTLLLVLLLSPTALALEESDFLQEQAQAIGTQDLEEAGQAYTGSVSLSDLDVGAVLSHILGSARMGVEEAVKTSVRSSVLILVVALLFGVARGVQETVGADRLQAAGLSAVLAIAAIAVGDVHSLLTLGEDTIRRMSDLADVLLPVVSMATAAGGSPTAAVVKQSITVLFSDGLIRIIHQGLVPLCYTFVAAQVAWAALGNDGLKRVAGFLKWTMATGLSVLLLAFVAYLNLSGVIAGGADAATVKAAKYTISNLVPFVGGVIADTAETLLVGAGVLRNGAGIFGMLAVLGVCFVPFLNLGAHYLFYKVTAALAATVAGEGRVTGLIDALSAAFGLVLAMAGSCAMLLILAMISAVKAVGG